MTEQGTNRQYISIIDVAQLAGVSKSTVSRVMNQVPGVNAEVVRNVQSAMEQLGYQPSARRRGPKTAARRGIRTGNILFLVLGFNVAELHQMPVFPGLLHGVEAAVREAGLFLVLAAYHPDESLPAALGSNQVDGVLLFQPATSPETAPPAIKSRFERLPSVGLMRGFEEPWPHIDRVLYNNAAIGPLAARFLLNRGHTRVAFLNIEQDHVAFIERQRSFVAAIRDAGATAAELVCMRRREEILNETEEFKTLVDSLKNQHVTGLFVPSDAQVPALYAALERAGIQPGKNLEIISCDNQPRFLSSVSPKPASIEINLEMVGRVGVQWLLWRLANLEQENRVTLLVEPFIVP
jgi:LacI family purine nucleotide synthesis repressor